MCGSLKYVVDLYDYLGGFDWIEWRVYCVCEWSIDESCGFASDRV